MKNIFIPLLLAFLVGNAWAEQAIRYTDSTGRAHYVAGIDQVPQQYRDTAVSVRTRDNVPDQKAKKEGKPSDITVKKAVEQVKKSASHSKEEIDKAIRFIKPITIVASDQVKAFFVGEVKNFLGATVQEIGITLEIYPNKAGEPLVITSSIDGKGGKGLLNAGETFKIYLETTMPVERVEGFKSKLNWKVIQVQSVPIKAVDNAR